MEEIGMPVVPYYPSEEDPEEDPPDVDGIIEDILNPGEDRPVPQS